VISDCEELVGTTGDYWPSYAVHLLYILGYSVHYCTSFLSIFV
jgi:hypothetical protein